MARHVQRVSRRRVLALVALVLVDVALWCAAFTAAWRHEHETSGSPDRVTVTVREQR